MIFQYTFIHNPCHPSRHAKPSSSHRLQRQANLQSTHIIVVIKVLKLCAIQASCVKSFHLFIFSLKCSPLSWHPSLKRQPHHIHSAHIAQPSHLMSHSPSTQPQSCHNLKNLSSSHAIHTMPCVLMHNLTSTHAFTALQGSKENFTHTHRVIGHLRATYASTICSSFQSGWSSHIAA